MYFLSVTGLNCWLTIKVDSWQIADQLGLKYGKKFAHEASSNANGTVNERVSHPDRNCDITFSTLHLERNIIL